MLRTYLLKQQQSNATSLLLLQAALAYVEMKVQRQVLKPNKIGTGTPHWEVKVQPNVTEPY